VEEPGIRRWARGMKNHHLLCDGIGTAQREPRRDRFGIKKSSRVSAKQKAAIKLSYSFES
jgi:hypothetical protein